MVVFSNSMSHRQKNMNIPAITKKHLLFALVLLLAFVVRALLIIYAQTNGGDWLTYERFADNILHGNGFSLSDPSSSVIVPSSGGYYPGFPAFIALVWLLFGKSVMAVLWAQLALQILALYWLLNSLLKLTKNIKLVIGAGVLLALSPLTAGWSRFPLTESLAITASMWFLAEIINSLAIKKLRVLPLAAALAVSIYIRPDTVLMAIAVLPVSMSLYERKRDSFKQIVVLILLTSVPVTAWMVRNVLIGRAPLSMHEGGGSFPIRGYRAWVNTWVVNEYDRADAEFFDPAHTIFHTSSFLSEAEAQQAHLLIDKLAVKECGVAIRDSIDAQFMLLANVKKARTGFFTKVELYVKRSCFLLLNPFSSWGLPLEFDYNFDRSSVTKAFFDWDVANLQVLLLPHKALIFGKLFSLIYRTLVFGIFFFMLLEAAGKLFRTQTVKSISERKELIFILFFAAGLVVCSRVFIFVTIGGLESRYLVEIIPWIEVSVVFGLFRNKNSVFLKTYK